MSMVEANIITVIEREPEQAERKSQDFDRELDAGNAAVRTWLYNASRRVLPIPSHLAGDTGLRWCHVTAIAVVDPV
jgi:hypothetical protein